MKKAGSMAPVAKAAGPAKAPVKTAAAKSSGSKSSSLGYPSGYDEKKYRTEDAMRTLMRAEELKKDKGLMKDVANMAKDQAAKLSGLCGKASK